MGSNVCTLYSLLLLHHGSHTEFTDATQEENCVSMKVSISHRKTIGGHHLPRADRRYARPVLRLDLVFRPLAYHSTVQICSHNLYKCGSGEYKHRCIVTTISSVTGHTRL
ncbi:hypothetical protein M378DRAFT_394034 [Amanita muscaria Koide BX008]|uniref:Secreted protein n=1 Tax=Amanita muscaria (strain Koide BX008) TaxID=946122 RepID=A0A0C2STM9_AMAMK|nr:hypothetical protein M378DRAFT_394034 [Amanita muscaria Koide BX008]